MDLDTKLLLTIPLAVVWGFLIVGGIRARPRVIEDLHRQKGVPIPEARIRATMSMNLIFLLESAAAVIALLFIW